MTKNPLVSIITVHYNVDKETNEFINSCSALTYSNFEVIIVDNGSTDPFNYSGSDARFRILRSEANLGFAGGNNLGIRHSKGDYLFFLNNDTLLEPGFIEPIVDFLESHPEAGALSPKVIYADGRTIQYAGSGPINNYTGRGKRLGKMEIDHGQYDYVAETQLGHGSAFVVPKKVIDNVGPMPEAYFLYYEEHDWCEQIKSAGYKIYYFGTSKILHKESMTTGKESTLKTYYMARNRLLYLRRNSHGLQFLMGLMFVLCVALPNNTIRYVTSSKFDLCKAYLRGYWWHLNHIKLKSAN